MAVCWGRRARRRWESRYLISWNPISDNHDSFASEINVSPFWRVETLTSEVFENSEIVQAVGDIEDTHGSHNVTSLNLIKHVMDNATIWQSLERFFFGPFNAYAFMLQFYVRFEVKLTSAIMDVVQDLLLSAIFCRPIGILGEGKGIVLQEHRQSIRISISLAQELWLESAHVWRHLAAQIGIFVLRLGTSDIVQLVVYLEIFVI